MELDDYVIKIIGRDSIQCCETIKQVLSKFFLQAFAIIYLIEKKYKRDAPID